MCRPQTQAGCGAMLHGTWRRTGLWGKLGPRVCMCSLKSSPKAGRLGLSPAQSAQEQSGPGPTGGPPTKAEADLCLFVSSVTQYLVFGRDEEMPGDVTVDGMMSGAGVVSESICWACLCVAASSVPIQDWRSDLLCIHQGQFQNLGKTL